MAVEVSENLKLSAELADWYWRFGVHRQIKFPAYAISTSEWLNTLYGVKKELDVVAEAAKAAKPCCAVWGPSQTGKSTLVSAYLDEKAGVSGTGAEAFVQGDGTALHWPGGEPALFMDPMATRNKKAAPGVQVLNPFNNGKDASACVSRFAYGSLQDEPGAYYVANPKFPIEVRIAGERDLMQALARGFDNWCWGHSPSGSTPAWNMRSLQEVIEGFQQKGDGATADQPVDQRAYELLHDFCEVLDELVHAGLVRFKELAENERQYRTTLASILADKSLISSFKNAEEFVTWILWDRCEQITREYRDMREAARKYEEQFAGKTLHCDIQTAVLLLDMDVYDLLTEASAAAGAPAGRKNPATVSALVRNMGLRVEGQRLFLGQFPDNRLFQGANPAKGFAIFQGLVWELVVPLNPAHLADSPFLQYLKNADLLDFPGVSNNPPNASTKVECECKYRQPPAMSEPGSQALEPRPKFDLSIFFARIVKDGKTASIVSAYARRLTIDGFVIFQNLDGQPAAQAEQLQTGIKTWWRSMTPDYFREPGNRSSPLPLNLGLLWWTRVFNEANEVKPNLGNYARIYANLGPLSDPKILNGTFALNYYQLTRGQTVRPADVLATLVQNLLQDPEFKRQFCNPESRQSFEKMVQDKATGGANYFFEQLSRQFQNLWERDDSSRGKLLERKGTENGDRIQSLIDWNNLFPPPEKRDIRKENLLKFQAFLTAKVATLAEAEMRRLNFALRVFLNVHQDDLSPLPSNIYDITPQFIKDQYQRWISCQLDRFRRISAAAGGDGTASVDWSLIGITNEGTCRDYSTALVNSVFAERNEGNGRLRVDQVAVWLGELVEFASSSLKERVDYRPYLATRMANEIAYGPEGIPTESVIPSDETVMLDPDGNAVVAPHGMQCPSYKVVVADFLERRLPKLIDMNVGVTTVVGLPGVKELETLCEKYNRKPQMLAGDQTARTE